MKSTIAIVSLMLVGVLRSIQTSPVPVPDPAPGALDIFDNLNDEKFYDRMLDFLDVFGTGGAEEASNRNPRVQDEERCRLPMRKGVCRALIPRFNYDPETQNCHEFKFGGCDGNGNNFATYKQCMDVCKGF